MSLAIDAIILFTAVIIVWRDAGRGFVRSFMGLITGIVSFIAAYAYTPVLSAYIKDKYLIRRITDGISEILKSLSFDTSTDLYNLDRLASDLPTPFTDVLDRYNVNIDTFADKIRGITGCGENTVESFSAEIADPTAQIIANAASFLIIFVAAIIALSLLTSLLDLIFKLPVLKSANSVLGLCLGIVEAALWSFVLATVLSALVSSLGAIDPALFGKDTVASTRICSFLLEHNPITKLTDIINYGV